MQRLWSTEEIGERWTLEAEDLAWLSGLPDAGKLWLAVQRMYWRRNGRFADEEADLAPAVIRHLATQNRCWSERTATRPPKTWDRIAARIVGHNGKAILGS
jgi:hypothetical protein